MLFAKVLVLRRGILSRFRNNWFARIDRRGGQNVNTARPVPRAAELQGVADLTRLSDDEVMVGLKPGSGDALATLFERFNRLVLSVALRIVRAGD